MARRGTPMMQGFTPADRRQARQELKASGRLEGKTKEQRQKMIGRRATRIANRAPAGTNPVKGLNPPAGTNPVGGMGTGLTGGSLGSVGSLTEGRLSQYDRKPGKGGAMAKGGMAKKKGYSKGGLVKSTGTLKTGIKKAGK